MGSSMWLLAVLAFGGSDFAASVSLLPSESEKSPVRRQTDRTAWGDGKGVNCVLWGDARPAGHAAGTTHMQARLFQTSDEAQEHFDASVRNGLDIVMYYKGCPCKPGDDLSHPFRDQGHFSARFNLTLNVVEDRTMYTWCKKANEEREEESPDKWKAYSFMVHPPVRKQAAKSVSMKQHKSLVANDEDEGPATAYTGEGDMRCVIAATASKDHSNVNATLFGSVGDASKHYDELVSLGTDLVIQYNGKREWKRSLAPKVKHVPWLSLLNWCKDIHTQWKADHKSIELGLPSKLVAESFARESPPLAKESNVPQEIDQGVSMTETAETQKAWVSADFATKTKYAKVQELLGHGMKRQVVSYKRFADWNCGVEDHTYTRLAGVDMSAGACKEACDKDLQCGCVQYDRSNGVCFYTQTAACHEKRCKKSKTTSIYLQKAQWGMDTKKVKKIMGKSCDGVDVMEGEEHYDGGGHRRSPGQVGGKVIGVEKNVIFDGACQELCASEKACTCFKFNKLQHTCTTMKECNLDKCRDSKGDIDMYVFEAVHNGYAADHAGQPW